MEPRRCSGPGPGLRHRLCHSNVINAEIESVSRDHYVGDDDGHNLSTAIAGMGRSEGGTETFVLVALHYSSHIFAQNASEPSPNDVKSYLSKKVCPECFDAGLSSLPFLIPRQGRKMRSVPL